MLRFFIAPLAVITAFLIAVPALGQTITAETEITINRSATTTESVLTPGEPAPARTDAESTQHERRQNLIEHREEMRADLTERQAERRALIEQTVAERRAEFEARKAHIAEDSGTTIPKLEERVHARLATLTARMIARIDITIERLEGIAARIESRIGKLQQENIDTNTAEEAVARARAEINVARSASASAHHEAESVSHAANSRVTFGTVRTHITEAVHNIRAAHRALTEATHALKTVIVE